MLLWNLIQPDYRMLNEWFRNKLLEIEVKLWDYVYCVIVYHNSQIRVFKESIPLYQIIVNVEILKSDWMLHHIIIDYQKLKLDY